MLSARLRRPRTARRVRTIAIGAATLAAVALLTGCTSATTSGNTAKTADNTTAEVNVKVTLTPEGCKPVPAKISSGHVNFTVSNKNAGAVSEAELRTKDLSHILAEQENLTPGLNGGFSLNIQPGSYVINCPGASQQHWPLTVTGKQSGPAWQSNPQLSAAVSSYATYINQNAATLITSTQTFCDAIDAGNQQQAELLYSPARIYYERIEPVAEIWGSLDTSIDGRWQNPVTVASKFTGFHKIEQLLWEDNTLTGAPALCAGLVTNEKDLQSLVKTAQYSPLEMAAGATDLINEAATAKISGEEERYSNVDLPTFKANVDGAMEVFTLLKPYLEKHSPATATEIASRYTSVMTELATLQASPGYLNTGYVEYSVVSTDQRKSLSGVVNAFAESLSKMSSEVS
jgi:iron uptake system component EfeO